MLRRSELHAAADPVFQLIVFGQAIARNEYEAGGGITRDSNLSGMGRIRLRLEREPPR